MKPVKAQVLQPIVDLHSTLWVCRGPAFFGVKDGVEVKVRRVNWLTLSCILDYWKQLGDRPLNWWRTLR